MKYQDRLELQKNITKLETNDFDYQDIKSILIDLREYSEFKSYFKELSHFVAHPERDKGLVHSNVEGYFCSLYVHNLVHQNIKFDRTKQPELFLRLAILFRAEQLQNDFYKPFKIQKNKFIQQVKDNFPLTLQKNFEWSKDQKFYEIVGAVISEIHVMPLFDGELLVNDFIKEFKNNKFSYDAQKLNRNRMTLMIIALLNDTEYTSKALNRKLGNIVLALEERDGIEYLGLAMQLDWLKLGEVEHCYVLPLLESDLIAKEWCTKPLLNYLSAQWKYGEKVKIYPDESNKKEINIYLDKEQDKFDIHYSS